MRKILIIAGKELLSTFRQRNLLFLMIVSPIILVAIMALAFGGFGGVSGSPDFADIQIAVVNLDQGFDLRRQLPVTDANLSLMDWEISIDGQTINLGEQLLQNRNLGVDETALNAGNASFNFGSQVAAILLSQPVSTTTPLSGNSSVFDVRDLACPLLPDADSDGDGRFSDSLDGLFDAVAVSDAESARAGVRRGVYAAAVIIPPDFSRKLVPDFDVGVTESISAAGVMTAGGAVEVFADSGRPISASIVRAVVEGIVSQFERVSVALSAVVLSALDTLSGQSGEVGADPLDMITSTLQGVDASALEPLACLITPGAGNIRLAQQPLDAVQERSVFSMLLVLIGGAQAVFFALFTGVFGINSIYEDRRQGTLQRVLVTPTPSAYVLAGRLLGNLVIVICQLLILLFAFTLIASLVEGRPTFIWGTNLPALLVVVMGLGLFTTGLGVLIVGLAPTSEQVQLIGPLITLMLGALGGTFGPLVPPQFAQISPTWWGIEAMRKLAANEPDIGLHLLVLFSVGLVFAGVGTFFFRRRMEL